MSNIDEIFSNVFASPWYISQCSPSRRLENALSDGFEISCFTPAEINTMVERYNMNKSATRRIDMNLPIEEKRAILLRESRCDSDGCLVDKKLADVTVQSALKPKGHLKWLSNSDIDSIMEQYERVLPHFKYITTLPSDYYEHYPDEFPQGITKYIDVAWVFNTDRVGQRGKHWVAVYVNNYTRTVAYFDSVGKPPNKYIKHFIDTYFGNYAYTWNRTRHQQENNECGVYSIFWILSQVCGLSLNELILDEKMHYLRAALFR